jgi:hypothetical protein
VLRFRFRTYSSSRAPTPPLRRSFRPPLVLQPICDASGHCGGHAQCTVNLDEVVSEICQCNRRRMVLQLARESVAQARVAPTVGSECPILLLLPSAAATLILLRIVRVLARRSASADWMKVTPRPRISVASRQRSGRSSACFPEDFSHFSHFSQKHDFSRISHGFLPRAPGAHPGR